MQLVSQLSTAVNVSSINPNLGILPGAVPQSQYIQQLISSIASPIIGQMPGSLLGNTIGSLYQSRGNHLPMLNQSYVNRMNMSAAGFVYQSQAAQQAAAYEEAKQKYAKAVLQGKQDSGNSAISGWRSLFRLSENDAGKTADNIGAVAKVLADQNYRNDVNSNTDRTDLIVQGAITASGLAATAKRGEFGGFSSVQVSQIAKQLAGRNMLTQDNISKTIGYTEQRYSVPANIDPYKHRELQGMDTLAKKTSMYLQDMAKAIQPLKDIFGNDIPSLYSSLEQLTGININGMSAQGISNLASNIRNTLTVTDASLTDVSRYQSGIQRLSDSYGIRMRPADKLNQALQFTRMAHNLQSSGYMTDAQMRQQLGTLTVGTANSEHADNYSKAYGMWVAADQDRRKLTQKQRRQQFRQAYEDRIKNSGMSADAALTDLARTNSVLGLRNTTYSHQARTDAAISARQQHITEQTNWAVQNQLLALSAADQKTVLADITNTDIDRDKLVGQIFQAYGNSDKLQGIRQNYGISQTTLDFLMRVGQNTTSDGRTIGAMNHAHNNDVKMRNRQAKIDGLAQKYQSTSQDLLYNIIRGGKIQDEDKKLFETQLDGVKITEYRNDLGGRKLSGSVSMEFNALSDEHQKKILQRAQREDISIDQATKRQLNIGKLEDAQKNIGNLGLDTDAETALNADLDLLNKLRNDHLLDTKDLQTLNKGLARQQYIVKINTALDKFKQDTTFNAAQQQAIENLAKAQKNAKAKDQAFNREAWLNDHNTNNVLTNDVLAKWDSIKQQQGIGTTMGQDIKGVLSTLVDIYRFLTRN